MVVRVILYRESNLLVNLEYLLHLFVSESKYRVLHLFVSKRKYHVLGVGYLLLLYAMIHYEQLKRVLFLPVHYEILQDIEASIVYFS